MDTRFRVYYLVNLNQNHGKGWWNTGYDNYGFKYDSNLRKLKQAIHSLKIMNSNIDWRSENFYQMKISCKIEEEPTLIDILNKLPLTNYLKLE